MKNLFSNSSPSSSSSTSYTTTNSKPATAGCIRSVLRRLLCFNTLPTHPSDQVNYVCDTQNWTKSLDNPSATPGLVARLMGLDTMPMMDFANAQINLNSITRSRSMDSVETSRKIEKQRNIKSTLSFRDAPAFLELESEEFFILSFEKGGETKEMRSKTRKSELGLSELKPRRPDKYKRRPSVHENDKENQENIMVERMKTHSNLKNSSKFLSPMKNCHSNSVSVEVVKQINKPVYNKEMPEIGKLRKKTTKTESGSPVKEVECDSENTSPVSVLDFAEFPVNFEVPNLVQYSRLTSSNSRRTLFEELENYKNSSPLVTSRSKIDDKEVKRIDDKRAGFWKGDYQSENYEEVWGEVCKIAESDLKQTSWSYREVWDLEEFKEIFAAFGLEILDQLLLELVDQVSSL